MLLVIGAIIGGMVAGSAIQGLTDELDLGQLPLVLLNGFGLWAAFTTFGLAASITFDRPGPAIGLSLAYLVINYFLEILGSLWADAAWTQDYSLFHHFNPGAILAGEAVLLDLVIVFVAAIVPVIYAIIVFPQARPRGARLVGRSRGRRPRPGRPSSPRRPPRRQPAPDRP